MKTKELLLAEDDLMLATLLRYRLEKSGYQVVLVHDGRAMKEGLEQKMPHAIICDVMMPYFSGIELVDYLRNELSSNIPIILISSASNEENIISAFNMGANDFMAKPVSPTELLARVSKELNRYYCT
ncbi:MAG: response regulator transcription factor [Croceitalea sp.]|nr:response regulator transcription factor [Croceitalea sp.]